MKSSPGSLLPVLEVSISEGQLIQLSEKVVGDVLLISVLRAKDELDSLGWRVCGDITWSLHYHQNLAGWRRCHGTHHMWETHSLPPGLNGPAVYDNVGILGDGDAFDCVGPEEREHQRKPLCDLRNQKKRLDAGADVCSTFTQPKVTSHTGLQLHPSLLLFKLKCVCVCLFLTLQFFFLKVGVEGGAGFSLV